MYNSVFHQVHGKKKLVADQVLKLHEKNCFEVLTVILQERNTLFINIRAIADKERIIVLWGRFMNQEHTTNKPKHACCSVRP